MYMRKYMRIGLHVYVYAYLCMGMCVSVFSNNLLYTDQILKYYN